MAATLVARGPSRRAIVRAASRMRSVSCFRGGAMRILMVRSLYMERLPYIDAYGVEVPAGADATWKALLRVARGALSGTGEHWLGRLLA